MVPKVSNTQKNFVGIFKITEEKSRIWIRSRIHNSVVRIRIKASRNRTTDEGQNKMYSRLGSREDVVAPY